MFKFIEVLIGIIFSYGFIAGMAIGIAVIIRDDLSKIADKAEINKRLLMYMVLIASFIFILHFSCAMYVKPYAAILGAKLPMPTRILWETTEYIDFIVLVFAMVLIKNNYNIFKKEKWFLTSIIVVIINILLLVSLVFLKGNIFFHGITPWPFLFLIAYIGLIYYYYQYVPLQKGTWLSTVGVNTGCILFVYFSVWYFIFPYHPKTGLFNFTF